MIFFPRILLEIKREICSATISEISLGTLLINSQKTISDSSQEKLFGSSSKNFTRSPCEKSSGGFSGNLPRLFFNNFSGTFFKICSGNSTNSSSESFSGRSHEISYKSSSKNSSESFSGKSSDISFGDFIWKFLSKYLRKFQMDISFKVYSGILSSAPSEFIRDVLQENFRKVLLRLLQQLF